MSNHELQLIQTRLENIHAGFIQIEVALRGVLELAYAQIPPHEILESITALGELVAVKLYALNEDLECAARDIPVDSDSIEGGSHE